MPYSNNANPARKPSVKLIHNVLSWRGASVCLQRTGELGIGSITPVTNKSDASQDGSGR